MKTDTNPNTIKYVVVALALFSLIHDASCAPSLRQAYNQHIGRHIKLTIPSASSSKATPVSKDQRVPEPKPKPLYKYQESHLDREPEAAKNEVNLIKAAGKPGDEYNRYFSGNGLQTHVGFTFPHNETATEANVVSYTTLHPGLKLRALVSEEINPTRESRVSEHVKQLNASFGNVNFKPVETPNVEPHFGTPHKAARVHVYEAQLLAKDAPDPIKDQFTGLSYSVRSHRTDEPVGGGKVVVKDRDEKGDYINLGTKMPNGNPVYKTKKVEAHTILDELAKGRPAPTLWQHATHIGNNLAWLVGWHKPEYKPEELKPIEKASSEYK